MDIYNYLKKDHRKVSALMTQVVEAKSLTKRQHLFKEIEYELLLHAETEQATFYATLEKEKETREAIDEAEEEHDEIRKYLRILSRLPVDSEAWIEQFGEFKHAVEHHVKEEETRIFPKAQKLLSEDEAEKLAQDMEAMKQKSKNRIYDEAV